MEESVCVCVCVMWDRQWVGAELTYTGNIRVWPGRARILDSDSSFTAQVFQQLVGLKTAECLD